MTSLDDLEPPAEPLENGGILLMQLAAAVDYLRRGVRPGFTVWDAIEEAMRWHTGIEPDWESRDPLARSLTKALADHRSGAAETFSMALRHWLSAAAEAFNDSLPWSAPSGQREDRAQATTDGGAKADSESGC